VLNGCARRASGEDTADPIALILVMLAPFPTPRTVPYLTGILAPALSSSRRAHANTFLALPCTKNRSRCQRASQRPSVASARPQQARPSQSVAIASRLTTRDERGEHMQPRPSGCERWARGKAMRHISDVILAQGGGTQDSEESTLRRVLRGRGKALHRSGFAGIQSVRMCSECSRSGSGSGES
jgi:hypothetical protein